MKLILSFILLHFLSTSAFSAEVFGGKPLPGQLQSPVFDACVEKTSTVLKQDLKTPLANLTKELIYIECFKETLFVEQELNGLGEERQAILRFFVEQSTDFRSRYRAGSTAIRVLAIFRPIGVQEQIKNLIDQTLGHCDSFATCNVALRELSEVVEYAPEESFDVVSENGGELFLSIQKLEKTFSKGVLMFRVRSLEAAALAHTRIQFPEVVAISSSHQSAPRIQAAQLSVLREKLQGLEQAYASIYRKMLARDQRTQKIPLREYIQSEFQKLQIEKIVLRDGVSLESLTSEENAALEDAINQMLSTMVRTALGNYALNQYLDRLTVMDGISMVRDQTNPGPWLDEMIAKSDPENKELDPYVAIFSLNYFAKHESKLPFRHEWVDAVKEISKFTPDRQDVKALVASAESLVQQTDKHISTILENLKLDQAIIGFEKTLATEDPTFGSLYHRTFWLLQRLGQVSTVSNQINALPKSDKSIAAKIERFNDNVDQAKLEFFTVACVDFRYRLIGQSYKQLPARYEIKTFDDKSVDLGSLCPKLQPANAMKAQLASKIQNDRMDAIWWPLKVEIAINVAMLPFTVGIAKLIEAPVRYASGGVLRFFFRTAATDVATQSALGIWAKWGTERLFNSAFTSLGFMATRKAVMSAIGFDRLYDPKKSIWDNYGSELVLGTVMFFFLPTVHDGAAWAASKTGMKKFSEYYNFAGEVAYFTSFQYFERGIDKVLGDKDPIWRGWDDMFGSFSASFIYSIAFRVQLAKQP